MLSFQMFDEARHRRTKAPDPVQFLGAGARRSEDPVGELPEPGCVVRLIHGEASYEHAADAIRPFDVGVFPGAPIAGRGRQHFDVVSHAQLLGKEAARMLRTRREFRAVAGRNERKLHAIAPLAASMATGPDGRASSTWAAGLRDFRRRMSQPGSLSIRRGAGFEVSLANISRYFRSITGQL